MYILFMVLIYRSVYLFTSERAKRTRFLRSSGQRWSPVPPTPCLDCYVFGRYPVPAGRRAHKHKARADRLRAPVHDLRIASFVMLRAGRVRDLAGSSYARAEEVEGLPVSKIV